METVGGNGAMDAESCADKTRCVTCGVDEGHVVLFYLPLSGTWLCHGCAGHLQALVDEIVAGQRSDWYGAQGHQVRGGVTRLQPGHAETDFVRIAERATFWLWDNDGDWR